MPRDRPAIITPPATDKAAPRALFLNTLYFRTRAKSHLLFFRSCVWMGAGVGAREKEREIDRQGRAILLSQGEHSSKGKGVISKRGVQIHSAVPVWGVENVPHDCLSSKV